MVIRFHWIRNIQQLIIKRNYCYSHAWCEKVSNIKQLFVIQDAHPRPNKKKQIGVGRNASKELNLCKMVCRLPNNIHCGRTEISDISFVIQEVLRFIHSMWKYNRYSFKGIWRVSLHFWFWVWEVLTSDFTSCNLPNNLFCSTFEVYPLKFNCRFKRILPQHSVVTVAIL